MMGWLDNWSSTKTVMFYNIVVDAWSKDWIDCIKDSKILLYIWMLIIKLGWICMQRSQAWSHMEMKP